MIKSALEFLMNAGKAEVIDIDGKKFTTKRVERVENPSPAHITMNTLTGLIEYVEANVDGLNFASGKLLVHVVNERTVKLCSDLQEDGERHYFIQCEALTPRLGMNTYKYGEKFNVMLQSCFLDNEDRARILNLVSNVKEEKVKNTFDDGVSQQIVAKTGIATVGAVSVPNPVTLIPFRTFIEVEQPESKFVFRVKDGPEMALFEADGGEWRLAAMLRIKKYIDTAFAEKNISVKVLA
jgi:hypothetical protein